MPNTSGTSRRLRKPKLYKPTDDRGVIVSVPIREFGFSHLLFKNYSPNSQRFKPHICSPTPHAYYDELAVKAWLRYQDLLEPILLGQQAPSFAGERPFWPSHTRGKPWIKRISWRRVSQLAEAERGLP